MNEWPLGAIALAALMAVAGCSSLPTSAPASPAPETPSPTPSSPTTVARTDTPAAPPTPSSTATLTATASPTPTPTPYLNPWHESEIVVGVDADTVSTNRAIVPLVRQSITYWENEGASYTDYSVSFVLDADAANPDLVVEFQSDVVCDGGNGTAIGCAPLIEAGETVGAGVRTIEIETGFVNATTVTILKHEFGHVLGIEHEDPPEEIMAARIETTAVAAPNASERLFPWRHRNLTVYIQDENLNLGGVESIRRGQIQSALTFYESDRDDGWIESVTFTLVDDRTGADIVIRATPSPGCDSGSCGQIFGKDTDADAPLEYYTFDRINVSTATEDNHYAWHVAYWLGYALGAEEYANLPDDLRRQDRDGTWWSE